MECFCEFNVWGAFHEQFFHRNSSSMEISLYSHPLYKWLQWNFAHGTTAVLSWHVYNFVEVWYTTMELFQNQFSNKLELWWNNRSWNGDQVYVRPYPLHCCIQYCDIFDCIIMVRNCNRLRGPIIFCSNVTSNRTCPTIKGTSHHGLKTHWDKLTNYLPAQRSMMRQLSSYMCQCHSPSKMFKHLLCNEYSGSL